MAARSEDVNNFLQGLQHEISPQTDIEKVMVSMKRDMVTLQDLAHMTRDDLYRYDVVGFSDAKIILERANEYNQDSDQKLVETTPYTYATLQDMLDMKLKDISPSVRDIVTGSLDARTDGMSSWEQFGEQLLGLTITELQPFQKATSPTSAIINRKIATSPSTTVGEVVRALEAIDRHDIIQHLLEHEASHQRASDTTKFSTSSDNFLIAQQLPTGANQSTPKLRQQLSADSVYTRHSVGTMYRNTRAQSMEEYRYIRGAAKCENSGLSESNRAPLQGSEHDNAAVQRSLLQLPIDTTAATGISPHPNSPSLQQQAVQPTPAAKHAVNSQCSPTMSRARVGEVYCTSNKELGDEDLRSIVLYTKGLSKADITRLGVQVGLRYQWLTDNMDNVNYLYEMLSAWLMKQDRVKEICSPTWANLERALREIGQNGMADRVAYDFIRP